LPDGAGLAGTIAIANAKAAYAVYHELFSGPRWQALRAAGARPQRLLWASTGTKNPAYSPLLYVTSLIGPDTVNTLPTDTYRALRATEAPLRAELLDGPKDAQAALQQLGGAGIDLVAVTGKLLTEGLASFSASFDKLLAAIAQKRTALLAARRGA
jgi:transaldolase/glucose-6-phosphate isomerase